MEVLASSSGCCSKIGGNKKKSRGCNLALYKVRGEKKEGQMLLQRLNEIKKFLVPRGFLISLLLCAFILCSCGGANRYWL